LEPIDEPEMSDLQLTVDTLKTSIRDSQRTIAELRAEADSRRKELAELHIARAQLEGRIREAERRLSEARHVIELQREELAGARSERERTSRTGARLHSQLKQPQKQMAALNTSSGVGIGGGPSFKRERAGIGAALGDLSDLIRDTEVALATPVVRRSKSPAFDEGPPPTHPVHISVKRGDTLWSIAQRYQISLKRLMALNGLADYQIQAGQVLWLAEFPAARSRSYEAAE
jgi:LysM repeat protein